MKKIQNNLNDYYLIYKLKIYLINFRHFEFLEIDLNFIKYRCILIKKNLDKI